MNYLITHARKLDWISIGCIFLLLIISLLMLYGMAKNNPSFYQYFQKQTYFIIAGACAVFLLSFLNYKILLHRKTLIWLYIAGIALLVAVLVLGTQIKGSRAWFQILGFNIQPVEFVKIIVILLLAKFFAYRHIESYRFYNLLVSGLYVLLPTALVLIQPDFGSALVLMLLWGGMMVFVGIRFRHLVSLFLISIIVFLVSWQFLFQTYQKERFMTFLNPSSDPFGSGYNIAQSKIAIGSGGIFGEGLGNGVQTQLRFLPEAHTDFILSSIGEEMGLFGIGIIFLLFTILISRFMQIAMRSGDNFAKLYCFGFSWVIAVHFFINSAMVFGLFPVTGLSLPFVSYGGSSLVSLFLGLGIIQSINARAA